MTNLGGHDMETVLEAFHAIDDDRPTCFIAYTIKGLGLPFAGHKDNHAGLMNPDQMAEFQRRNRIPEGAEWDRFAGLDLPEPALRGFLDAVPFAARGTAALPRRAGRGAGGLPRPVPRRRRWDDIDPGRFRPNPGRSGARRRRAGRAHRHHLARRHGLDQPGRLGQSPRHLRPPPARGRVQGAEGGLGPALGHVSGRASTSSWASPKTTCSFCSARWACPTRCSAPVCCRSARFTIPSSSAAWMR